MTIFSAADAITVAVGASSAIPFASFPIIFAVAGTTNITSAHLAHAICTTSAPCPANKSVKTSCPDKMAIVLLGINSCAACVIDTLTFAPILINNLTSVADLYAATLPETTIKIFLFLNIFLSYTSSI